MNIFLNKKILIYGLGKSGISAFEFLKKKNDIFLYDDYKLKLKTLNVKKNLINFKDIAKIKFDLIILSPGINIHKCKLSKYLKKNFDKIYSDLDIFYSFYKNDCITITGTNGKSTTCQLMYEVLLDQKFDVKLVGNIGNPILSVNNVRKKTIFVIEASSYQLEYSKIFKSKYAAILNLSPDHIERHKSLHQYVKAKFKLFKNQNKSNLAFINQYDLLINKELKFNNIESKIIKVNTKKNISFLKNIDNFYFSTNSNKENLLFVLEISKKLKLKNNSVIKTIKRFKGLKYRQQIIFRRKYLTVINDSKSTSFSSSISLLEKNYNIYWLLGGIPKKGDKMELSRNFFDNIKAFVYGKNRKFFNKKLKGKIKYKNFNTLKDALKEILKIVKEEKFINKTIIFSPCAASFDDFKNFEDRGLYFNRLINKYLNELQ